MSGKAGIDRRRIGAARFAVGYAAVLAAVKFGVGLLTGSLGIVSSAVDNVADIVMSGVNFLSIRKSAAPPDANHPYGHGKVETVASLFEGAVVALIGAWIVNEGVRRLRARVFPGEVDLGIVVMGASVAASWYIARYLRRVGEETDSPGLKADSLHYRTDIWSGGGVLLSLLVFRLTEWKWVDAAVGMVVGAYIIVEAAGILWEAVQDLVDRGLPPETVGEIRRIIDRHRPMLVDFHDLRTRRSGAEKHVDFHVVICREHKLEDAHRLADHLEWEVSRALGNAHVVTHIDPCEIECPGKDACERILTDIRNLDDPRKKEAGAREPGAD